jgi:hypothetical protein
MYQECKKEWKEFRTEIWDRVKEYSEKSSQEFRELADKHPLSKLIFEAKRHPDEFEEYLKDADMGYLLQKMKDLQKYQKSKNNKDEK